MDDGFQLQSTDAKGEGVFATRSFRMGETVMIGRRCVSSVRVCWTATAGRLKHVRNGYSDYLQESMVPMETLRTDGYEPAAIHDWTGRPQSPVPVAAV
jgi:hypothetical protein